MERFLQFAGYRSLSCFDEVRHEDLKTWSGGYDAGAIAAAMRALVAISTLDGAVLAVEAREIVRFLDRKPDAKPYALNFPGVDIPSVDWAEAAALPLEKGKLETAIRHGSEWLAYVAGNLHEAFNVSENDARRILAGANGASLWAGAEIAHAKLPPESATRVLVERLTSPLPRGAGYIFGVLKRLKPPITDNLAATIALGLDDRDGSTVTSAAEFGLALVMGGQALDPAPVTRAYTDWQAHEARKKDKHVQGPSPLETLLKLRIALGDIDDEVLATALGDGRSDVRKVAQEERDKRASA